MARQLVLRRDASNVTKNSARLHQANLPDPIYSSSTPIPSTTSATAPELETAVINVRVYDRAELDAILAAAKRLSGGAW